MRKVRHLGQKRAEFQVGIDPLFQPPKQLQQQSIAIDDGAVALLDFRARARPSGSSTGPRKPRKDSRGWPYKLALRAWRSAAARRSCPAASGRSSRRRRRRRARLRRVPVLRDATCSGPPAPADRSSIICLARSPAAKASGRRYVSGSSFDVVDLQQDQMNLRRLRPRIRAERHRR